MLRTWLAFILVLLSACGSGGSSESSATPEPFRLVIINCLPARIAVQFEADLYELGNIFNEFGSIADELNTPESFAEIVDRTQVDAVFAAATTASELDLGVFLGPPGHPNGDLVLAQIEWAPGQGSVFLKLILNPSPPEPDEQYTVQLLSEAEYQQMLSDGSIQGVLGE